MEQSVEIAPEFGSSALLSSLFIIFVSCCKYKFDFCKVKSVLASENDIFVDGFLVLRLLAGLIKSGYRTNTL